MESPLPQAPRGAERSGLLCNKWGALVRTPSAHLGDSFRAVLFPEGGVGWPLDQCPFHVAAQNQLFRVEKQAVGSFPVFAHRKSGQAWARVVLREHVDPRALWLSVQSRERGSEGQPCSQVIVGVQTAVAGPHAAGTSHLSLGKALGNNSPDAPKPDAGWCGGLSLCLICL